MKLAPVAQSRSVAWAASTTVATVAPPRGSEGPQSERAYRDLHSQEVGSHTASTSEPRTGFRKRRAAATTSAMVFHAEPVFEGKRFVRPLPTTPEGPRGR